MTNTDCFFWFLYGLFAHISKAKNHAEKLTTAISCIGAIMQYNPNEIMEIKECLSFWLSIDFLAVSASYQKILIRDKLAETYFFSSRVCHWPTST